jgi:hypothetical protein
VYVAPPPPLPVPVTPPPVHLPPPPIHVPSLPPVPAHVTPPATPVQLPAPVPLKAPSTVKLPPVHVTVPSVTTTHAGSTPSGKTISGTTSAPAHHSGTTISRARASSLSSASGPNSSYANQPGAGPPAPLTLSRLDERWPPGLSLRAKVLLLRACLGDLPRRLRLVLELRTGINMSRALSPGATARYLHVKVRDIATLEKRALRVLRRTARTHACGAALRDSAGLLILGGGAVPAAGNGVTAIGGVKAARYAKTALPTSPGAGPKQASTGGDALGISRPPNPGDTLVAVAVVLAGMLLIAVLFAEELGLGPRYRRWQSRLLHRRPR